ncbi:MAG: PCMD domain-containing protein [Odoribacter splanchnicus]
MKKLILFLFVALLTQVFTSCKDDDEYFITDADLNGVYFGTMDVDAPLEGVDISVKDIKQKIYITKTNENLVKLELKNFVFSYGAITMPIGDIVVDNIKVSKSGDVFSLDGTGSLDLQVGHCEVSVSGDVTVAGVCNINIGVNVTSPMEMKVKVAFNGKRTDADKSSEAAILKFDVDSPVVLGTVIGDDKIVINVADTTEDFNFTPVIEVSAGAKITPESGKKQDFTQEVVYTVVSEDGIVTREYKVTCEKRGVYNFEGWSVDKSNSEEKLQYPLADGWATCNPAVMLIKGLGALAQPEPIVYEGPWAVNPTTTAHSGEYAAEIQSLDTKGGNMMGQDVPKVTAGTIFLGTFDAMAALGGAMKATKFGIMYEYKPLAVSGYYQYTPGETYYNKNEVDPTGLDSCSVAAVLYEVSSDSKNEILDGSNIYTSDKIVAIGQFADGKKVTDWTSFKFDLNYIQSYDPEKLYRFAIIFSSSKEGAAYKGAIGSKMLIDDVEVVVE